MSMAECLVSSTVASLGDLLTYGAEFLLGVEGQVKRLQAELRRMQGFLNDADARQDEDRIRFLLVQVKIVAYDAENVVETYALKSASNRAGGPIDVLKRLAGIYTDHDVGSEIEAITSRISELTQRLQSYGVRVSSQGEGSSSLHARQREQRRSYPHIADQNIVGIEEKKFEELVTYLVAEERNYRLVSICGVGAFVNTILAKNVYHRSKVIGHFDHFVWVDCSQQYEIKDFCEGICRQRPWGGNDYDLISQICKFLERKKCLVVLNDIWNVEASRFLLDSFTKEKTRSSILLTTRDKNVALFADPRAIIYQPQFLNDEESWELLQKRARRDCADFIDTRMEELGKKMVYHCQGSPLTITVLGGILATKYSSNEWQMVHDNIESFSRRAQDYGEELLDILNLSYKDLPTWLKPCFLYLSQFPEEINVNKLIRLWIAEGFVPPVTDTGEEEEMLEDVAECYLNELVQRYMVLVGERDANLRIKTCRLHPLVTYMCLSKSQHESFHHIINYQHGHGVGLFSSISTSRRLAIHMHGHSCQFPLDYITSPDLRSLLCFYDFSHERWRLRKPVFDNLKLLRVLDLEGADIGDGEGDLLKDVGELIYLRFLSLRHARVSKIPSSIGNLRWLQTLDLLIGGIIVHIPNVIWKMGRLRHLYLPEFCDAKTKLRLDKLTNLRTLVNFSTQNCDVRDLFSMTNLRELTIRDPISIKNFTKFSKSLSIRLKHLRALSLDNSHEEDDREATKFKDLRSISFGDFTVPRMKTLPYGLRFVKNHDHHQGSIQWGGLLSK